MLKYLQVVLIGGPCAWGGRGVAVVVCTETTRGARSVANTVSVILAPEAMLKGVVAGGGAAGASAPPHDTPIWPNTTRAANGEIFLIAVT